MKSDRAYYTHKYLLIKRGKMIVKDFEAQINNLAYAHGESNTDAYRRFVGYLPMISLYDRLHFSFLQYLVHFNRDDLLAFVLTNYEELDDIRRVDLVMVALRRNATKTLNYLLRVVTNVSQFLRFDTWWKLPDDLSIGDYISHNPCFDYIYKMHQAHNLRTNTQYFLLNLIVSTHKDSRKNLKFILEEYKQWSGKDIVEIDHGILLNAFDDNNYPLIPILLDNCIISDWTQFREYTTKLMSKINDPIIRRVLLQLKLKYPESTNDNFCDTKNRSLLHFAVMYNDISLLKLIINNQQFDWKTLVFPDNSNLIPIHYVNDYNDEMINFLKTTGMVGAPQTTNMLMVLLDAARYKSLLSTIDENNINQTALYSDAIQCIVEYCGLAEIHLMMGVCKYWCTSVVNKVYNNSTLSLNIVLVDISLEAKPLLITLQHISQ
jgi:hypothetical protein